MKVYLELPTQSRGIKRVYDALIRYKPPNVEVVTDPRQSDLTILHVTGRHHRTANTISLLRNLRKPYAMIQYCLRSTMNPNTDEWIENWRGAKLVWSYYNLPELCREDGVTPNFAFYHSPLGVDSEVFQDRNKGRVPRNWIVIATSQHALSEGARECAFAAQRVGRRMAFIGHELRRPSVLCFQNFLDEQVAALYNTSEFVSGLRRVEGFELPAAEGLLCGARPILFDLPCYRQWYDDLAVFIPQEPRDKVIDNLERIFRHGVSPVTDKEKSKAKERFNWETIINGFWQQIV